MISLDTRGFVDLVEGSVLDASIEYARRGFRVVALHGLREGTCTCRRGAACGAAGKHPLGDGWQKRATSDPREIRAWFSEAPVAGVGLAMGGAARLVALDVDGERGRGSLALLEDAFGSLPRTLRSRSGGGGEHRVFFVPEAFDVSRIRNRAGMLGEELVDDDGPTGLDVRTEGGQIVVSPTLHKSGQRYVWTDDAPPAALPHWLFDLMVSPVPAAPRIELPPSNADRDRVRKRALAYLATLPPAISGQGGHRATFRAALALVRGFCLDDGEAYAALATDYNSRCDPPWTPKELVHKITQARASTRVGYGWLLHDPGRRRPEVPPAPAGFARLPADKSAPVVLLDDAAQGRAYAGLCVRAGGTAPAVITLGGRWHPAWATVLRARNVRVAVLDRKLAERIVGDVSRAGASTTWTRPRAATSWVELARRRVA
jgi:hypothetical protein